MLSAANANMINSLVLIGMVL